MRLRAVEPGDLEVIVAGDHDTDSARSGWRIFPPRSVWAAAEWVDQQTRRPNDGDEFRLVIEALDSTDAVGSLNTQGCDPVAGTFGYGITVAPWARRRGYASDAVIVLLGYLFGERRYQKCTVGAYAFNEGSVAFHQALGFQIEGHIRRAHFTAGRHWDEVVLGLTVEEFTARHPLG